VFSLPHTNDIKSIKRTWLSSTENEGLLSEVEFVTMLPVKGFSQKIFSSGSYVILTHLAHCKLNEHL
jgi:hypothetical protein